MEMYFQKSFNTYTPSSTSTFPTVVFTQGTEDLEFPWILKIKPTSR